MQINIQDLHNAVHDAIRLTKPSNYKPGRSIVTTSYSAELPSTWVLLNELKRLNCQLPVEIFHRPGELSSKEQALLESVAPGQFTVKTIQGNPKDYISKYGHKHGWACKIYALIESEYSENLWLDCDNCPIRDPEFLFDDPEYVTKGSLFWRDMMSPDAAEQYVPNSVMWPIFNIPYNDSEPFEAGQLLINKVKCYLEFSTLKHYTDNCEIYFGFGGDKEVFKFAWQKLGIMKGIKPLQINYHSDPNVPFGFIPFGPFSKGVPNIYKKWGGGTVMVQRDRDGNELFNHRNMSKFKLDGNPFMTDIQNEKYYHEHLNKLKGAL